jgi:hypothetical protein
MYQNPNAIYHKFTEGCLEELKSVVELCNLVTGWNREKYQQNIGWQSCKSDNILKTSTQMEE